jgi:hypothetical protein
MRALAALVCGISLTLACTGEVDIAKSPPSAPGAGAGGQNDVDSGSPVLSSSTSSGVSGSGASSTSSSSGAGSSNTSTTSSPTSSPCVAGASSDAPGSTDAGRTVTITFDGVSAGFGPTYTESGFTVAQTSGGWVPATGYGNPAPFIEFIAPAGSTVTGEIRVTAGGATFGFTSVDLYSSTTTIPYTFVGMRNCATVFTETNTVPNTFGDFRTVVSQHPTAIIDTLSITLTDPAAPCCTNPTGLDNIVLTF